MTKTIPKSIENSSMTAKKAFALACKSLKKEHGKHFLQETAFLLAELYLLEEINKRLFLLCKST